MKTLLALAAWLLCGAALAQPAAQDRLKAIQADPAALKAAVEAGKKASFFCANCHGEDGVSKSPEIPNLAGQNPAYLLEQVRKFGSGERKDPFMQGLIKVLKDEERVQIALFYASTTVLPSRSDAAQAAQGKVLFGKLCSRCHGEQAHGNETFPRLAGQKQPYLRTSIMRYRDGTGERNNQLMSIATASLKNEDITALTNYLGQLP
ncbi:MULTISPECIES: c-type cytochrome [Dechloromonas]|uniref:Cytochrome C n=1 Tax=Dechloromonas denitrificans TaxID=281362 RepID=A0A133XIK1_9RHOO|nr:MULTISPECIES: c-type cytochrome [Dechloromonas]KXB30770.1 cytochrome C [Dechloromonas denitrificans]